MPLKRALVECAVLSLQDSCVFYPYCKGCFSKIDTDSSDTRLTCSKCGYSCAGSLVHYRYRLSMRVARESCVFGVTVFGNCLNPFFGTHASDLQKLVTDICGPLEALSKSTLLVKAVEDCFIGKHFIFGVKVTSDSEPWLGRTNNSCRNEMAQLIATQMILPKAAGSLGCTVLNYYEAILQKATEYKLHTTDACNTFVPGGKPLLLTQCNSPTSRFMNDTPCYSGCVSLQLSRSQHQDSSLSPTPPWQQTLGLITSSAEQEESRNYYKKTQKHIDKDDNTTDPSNLWLGVSPYSYKTVGLMAPKSKDISSPDITKSLLTSSIALEDIPLSESLAEFLNEKNGPEDQPQKNNFSVVSICQKNIQTTRSQLNGLLTVSHRGPVHNDERPSELQDSKCEDCNSNKAETCEPSNTNEEEEFEGTVYNCSADLFSSSPRMDMNTASLDTPHFQNINMPLSASKRRNTVDSVDKQSTTEACSLSFKLKHLSEKVDKPFTTDHQTLKMERHCLRESFPHSTKNYLQPFDFIPPSQSTPVKKKTSQKECVQLNLLTKHVRASVKENIHNYCVTPKSRYKNYDKNKYDLAQQRIRARREVLNTRPKTYKRRSSVFEDSELIVPPTPANHLTSIFKNSKLSLKHTVTLNTDSVQTECRPLPGDSNTAVCTNVLAVGGLSECNNADDECDWSRDLFSDSV